MKKYIILFFVIIGTLSISSCNNSEELSSIPEEMINCYRETEWNSLKVHNKLIGEWEWEAVVGCGLCKPNALEKTNFNGLSIEFKTNNELYIKQQNKETIQTTWEIIEKDNAFAISTAIPTQTLYGRIVFCENRLLTNNSYRDGLDNLFKKKIKTD